MVCQDLYCSNPPEKNFSRPLFPVVGVHKKEAHNMDAVIKNYLEQFKVGRKQSYKNLALYPLLSTSAWIWNT